jgi:hypothetical protein
MLLRLINEAEDVKVLVFCEYEAQADGNHEIALKHEGESPTNVFLQDGHSDGTKDVPDHDSYDYKGVQDSHPLGVTFFGREFVNPDWAIDHAKGLSEAKHEAHEVEDPDIGRQTENETSHCIGNHVEAKYPACLILLEDGTDKKT